MPSALIDPALLLSFCAVADTGSFTRAAESVHLTQSTVSQQIRRLEEQLGCALLDRSGRHVVCTPEGERLLAYAQRITALMSEAVEQLAGSGAQTALRLGVPEDFAAQALTPAFAAFARRHPQVRLEVSSGLSRLLWQQFQQGELDIVLVKQRTGSAAGLACWPEPLAWIDSAAQPVHGLPGNGNGEGEGEGDAEAERPLPLVVFPQDGLYRSEMTHALDAAGRRWRIAYISASLASLSAAVQDGLGVSLLPRRLAGAEHRILGSAEGFAPVPDVEVALHVRSDLAAPGRRLAEQLRQVCESVLGGM